MRYLLRVSQLILNIYKREATSDFDNFLICCQNHHLNRVARVFNIMGVNQTHGWERGSVLPFPTLPLGEKSNFSQTHFYLN